MVIRKVVLAALCTLGAVVVAGCGGSSFAGSPSYALVKRVALAAPQLMHCNSPSDDSTTYNGGSQAPAPGVSEEEDLDCRGVGDPLSWYEFSTAAAAMKAAQTNAFALFSGETDAYLVDGRTVVHANSGNAPSNARSPASEPANPQALSGLVGVIMHACRCGTVIGG
jgi:hypothetical protein